MGRVSKERGDNGSQKVRSGLLCVLMIGAAYSIYAYGVRVGAQPYTESILMTRSAAEAESRSLDTETETDSIIQERKSPRSSPRDSSPLQSSPGISTRFVLGIPEGEAQALPSIREASPEEDASRAVGHTKYGGAGDKQHLGGFTTYDGQGVSPAVWKHMMSHIGVKSIMDVGCGKGVSTLYFLEHGADVLCLEGSHDAVQQTFLPDPEHQVVEHDFSRGPYWPGKTYDAVWSVEFLEHVGRNYHFNYIQAFRKAALLFVTASRWGGWHHVEVHMDDYWLSKFQMYGFQYSQILTDQIRKVAVEENHRSKTTPNDPANQGPDGQPYNAQHVWLTMMVFVNPAVASLPEHAHLMAEPGCYKERATGTKTPIIIHRDCKAEHKESELPEAYFPLIITPEKHSAWLQKVKARVMPKKEEGQRL